MSARMQFCGRFPGLCAVSGIWSGAAADSLSLGSKRSGCVGLQSTQPKHRRFETVRLSASRPSAGRSTQSPGTSAKLLHGRTRGCVGRMDGQGREGQGQGLNLWDCVEDGKALLWSCCLCVEEGKAFLWSSCLCVEDGKALLRSCCLCVEEGKALLRSCCLCVEDGRVLLWSCRLCSVGRLGRLDGAVRSFGW